MSSSCDMATSQVTIRPSVPAPGTAKSTGVTSPIEEILGSWNRPNDPETSSRIPPSAPDPTARAPRTPSHEGEGSFIVLKHAGALRPCPSVQGSSVSEPQALQRRVAATESATMPVGGGDKDEPPRHAVSPTPQRSAPDKARRCLAWTAPGRRLGLWDMHGDVGQSSGGLVRTDERRHERPAAHGSQAPRG